MAKTLQLLRGTTAQNDSFTGHVGELTVDTTKNELRLHDGSTAGGHIIYNKSDVDTALTGEKNKTITNCITEIPQDINLTLSSGTLTLKAGSKLYKPNGSGVFDEVITNSDLSVSPSGFSTSSNRMVVYQPNGTIGVLDVYLSYVYSGTTAPTTFDGNGRAFWYDTTNNSIKKTSDSGSTWTGGYGFPIALVHITNGVGIDEIEQLFNGIGFIGRTLYVLPGVKALHSNGFNNDGTLKNDITTVSSVLTHTGGISDNLGQIILNKGGTSCQFASLTTSWKYDSIRNIFYWSNNNDTNWINIGTYYYDTTEKYITQFNPKLAFHAVDYSDFSNADGQNVKLTGNQTIGGTKTFSSTISGSITGNAGTVTNGVYTTGNQTIGGTKTFTGVPYFAGGANSSEGGEIQFAPTNNDSNNNTGYIDVVGTSTNERIRLRLGTNEGIMAYNDGKAKCTAPAASSSTSDTWIATTGWVNDSQKSTNVVHRAGTETIGGTKTFSAAAYGVASDTANSVLTTVIISKVIGANTGYVKLGNGMIIQWGRSTIADPVPSIPTNVNIVFPYAFSSDTSFSVAANNYVTNNTGGGYTVGISNLTTTGFTYHGPTASSSVVNNLFWVAIGF